MPLVVVRLAGRNPRTQRQQRGHAVQRLLSDWTASILLAAVVCAGCAAGTRGEAVSISPRPGVEQRFLVVKIEQPVASVVLLPGAGGDIRIREGSVTAAAYDLLVRTRTRFADEGFNVALVDTPSDRPNLRGFRISPAHAADLEGVIAYLRSVSPRPVWLIGTSRGTVSVASVAGVPGARGPDGIVLTSSVSSRQNGDQSLADVDLSRIRVPTLFVHHRQDTCPTTPYAEIPRLMARLSNAPRVDLVTLDGGAFTTQGCAAQSAHTFWGLDEQVVTRISQWIKANTPR